MDSSLLDQLLKYHARLDTDNYFLSGYFVTNGLSLEQAQYEVEHKLLTKLKHSSLVRKASTLHHLVVNHVAERIRDFDQTPAGVAVFSFFNVKDDDTPSRAEEVGKNVLVVGLESSPENSIYIGKTFLLDQLVAHDADSRTGLVVGLHQDEARMYVLHRDSVELLYSFENEEVTFLNTKYLQRMGGQVKGRYISTGRNKEERRQQMHNKNLVNDIVTFIGDHPQLERNFRYLIVLYSHAFDSLVGDKDGTLGLLKDRFILLYRQTNLNKETKIAEVAHELIDTHESESKKRALEVLRARKSLFVVGWKDVCKKASKGAVDMLFLTNGARRAGYLSKDLLVSSYPVSGSKRIKNVVPWLVRLVVSQGGEVIMVDPSELGKGIQVLARVRY